MYICACDSRQLYFFCVHHFPPVWYFIEASVKVAGSGNCFLCYLTMLLFANAGVGYRPINVCGALGKGYWHEVTEVLGGNPDQVPVCPSQILHRIAWDRIWASAMRDQRLTAWTIARPGCWPSFTPASSALMYVDVDGVSCSLDGLCCLAGSNWKVTSLGMFWGSFDEGSANHRGSACTNTAKKWNPNPQSQCLNTRLRMAMDTSSYEFYLQPYSLMYYYCMQWSIRNILVSSHLCLTMSC